MAVRKSSVEKIENLRDEICERLKKEVKRFGLHRMPIKEYHCIIDNESVRMSYLTLKGLVSEDNNTYVFREISLEDLAEIDDLFLK